MPMPDVLPTPVLIFFAVKEEARPFLSWVESTGISCDPPVNLGSSGIHYRFNLWGRLPFRVVITGMGKANARAVCAEALQRELPSCVLSCGFAGALDPCLRPGHILYQANEFFPQETSLSLNNTGQFYCADAVVRTVEEKESLFKTTGCRGVEMESGVIMELCTARKIPCAIVRSISDSAQESLPLDFAALIGANGRISIRLLVRDLCCHPGNIPSLIRLGFNSRKAARNLSGSLQTLLLLST